ncbi:Uncharacterized BCR, YitT family COG1284 [Metamycoplasma cloacale]|uniref:YitT family protein n=1 Tax=Metamycoplasma cloacale TaxID=92401 RepID=A0A2Z4LLD8_9BACT|nr:YitT family protein [Metamycoplasma cloacale]AWX42506.1 YitT family protein [Metamycoplasma cloacale]VEU79148.1 Uncharacterized BCR, YitT family COG1284 [Metamycoplasma cloacale]
MEDKNTQLGIEKQGRMSKRKRNSINYFDVNPHKLNLFNIWKKFPKKVFLILLSAILYNLGVAIFLAKAATVASGVAAIVQLFTLTIAKIAPYFAFIYLAANLPLIIIFWKKNSRLFMILTLYWLLFQVVFQSFMFIPAVRELFDKITIYIINWRPGITYSEIIPWNVYGHYPSTPGLTNSNPTWPIIIYAIIGAICSGLSAGIAWKYSGSTAGSDIIVYYFSYKKKKSIGIISTIISFIFSSLSIIVIFIIEYLGVGGPTKHWNSGAFILRVISSILYIFFFNFFVELLYPKYKKIKIEIYTKKPNEIIQHLKSINYWHGYNYSNVTSGYNNTETTKIETIALYLEQSNIKNEILKIDPQAWISVTLIHRIFGNLNTSKVEN